MVSPTPFLGVRDVLSSNIPHRNKKGREEKGGSVSLSGLVLPLSFRQRSSTDWSVSFYFSTPSFPASFSSIALFFFSAALDVALC
jgi:hypothetical protein